ncbi:MAG: VOC family protein [Balneolaceae bacterium]|nr:VOC family protein [Balneolaceae bacterium]
MIQPTPPKEIDHFIYTSAKLETGMAEIEQLLEIRPEYGGRHLQYGTHNALVSLGPSVYLEIISPDPASKIAPDQTLFSEYFSMKSKLTTWVYRTNNIHSLVKKVKEAGFELGEVQQGSRQTAEKTLLKWHLTNPRKMLFNGAVPFLIDWGQSKHPAWSAPEAGTLVDFNISHPQPELIKKALEAIGTAVNIEKSSQIQLTAFIETKKGTVALS